MQVQMLAACLTPLMLYKQ